MAVEVHVGEDIPYIESYEPPTYDNIIASDFLDTLARNGWQAQADAEKQKSKPDPPACYTIPLALLSFVFCPLLGCLSVIYAIESHRVYKHGKLYESAALGFRSRGTACFAIAIGIGFAIGFGVLLGLGSRFNWYEAV